MERKKYKVTVEVVAIAEIEKEADSVDELYKNLDVDDIYNSDITNIDDATILYYEEIQKIYENGQIGHLFIV